MFHQGENVNKETEIIKRKKNQMEILKLKNAITEILKFTGHTE